MVLPVFGSRQDHHITNVLHCQTNPHDCRGQGVQLVRLGLVIWIHRMQRSSSLIAWTAPDLIRRRTVDSLTPATFAICAIEPTKSLRRIFRFDLAGSVIENVVLTIEMITPNVTRFDGLETMRTLGRVFLPWYIVTWRNQIIRTRHENSDRTGIERTLFHFAPRIEYDRMVSHLHPASVPSV